MFNILKLAIPWGGMYATADKYIELENTCTIDVGLTVLTMITEQYPNILTNLPNNEKTATLIDMFKERTQTRQDLNVAPTSNW